jgi:hypothetical protein
VNIHDTVRAASEHVGEAMKCLHAADDLIAERMHTETDTTKRGVLGALRAQIRAEVETLGRTAIPIVPTDL